MYNFRVKSKTSFDGDLHYLSRVYLRAFSYHGRGKNSFQAFRTTRLNLRRGIPFLTFPLVRVSPQPSPTLAPLLHPRITAVVSTRTRNSLGVGNLSSNRTDSSRSRP